MFRILLFIVLFVPIAHAEDECVSALTQHHRQVLIWDLLEAGKTEQAQALQKELEDELLKGVPTSIKLQEVHEGERETYLFTFESGLQALFKTYPPDVTKTQVDAELAAYSLDRLIGLNMVPTTLRWYYKDQMGIIQPHFPNAVVGSSFRGGFRRIVNRLSEMRNSENDVRFFEDIMDCCDPYYIDKNPFGSRFIVDKSGRLIMMDFTGAFFTSRRGALSGLEYAPPLGGPVVPHRPEVLERLRALQVQELHEELDDLIQPIRVMLLYERIQSYLEHVDQLKSSSAQIAK